MIEGGHQSQGAGSPVPLATVTLQMPVAAADKLCRLMGDVKSGDPAAIDFAKRMADAGFPIVAVVKHGQKPTNT
jgi:hypothetical protein